MENIQFADALVREYLTFRGFSGTVRALDHDLAEDKTRGFQVKEIVRELQGLLARRHIDKAMRYWDMLHGWFTSKVDADVEDMAFLLRTSLQKLFLVQCYADAQRQGGRGESAAAIEDFFRERGESLKNDPAWKDWFALPFVRSADTQPPFNVYFSKQWQESFFQSLRNFFSSIFHQMHIQPSAIPSSRPHFHSVPPFAMVHSP